MEYISGERDNQILTLYLHHNMSRRDICKMFNLNKTRVSRILSSFGIPPGIDGSRNKNRDNNLEADFGDGVIPTNILAKKYKISRQRIHQIIKKRGNITPQMKRERALYNEKKEEIYRVVKFEKLGVIGKISKYLIKGGTITFEIQETRERKIKSFRRLKNAYALFDNICQKLRIMNTAKKRGKHD